MNAAIITIGDELLIGQVIDTNSSWLASELNKLGIIVSKIISIGDSENEITKTINDLLKSVDIIITTGGLGPTKDDITKDALCKIFNTKLVFNNTVIKNITNLLSDKNISLNANNQNQAYVPEKAKILNNSLGTAPGLFFEEKGTDLFVLPGVPFEMKSIFENHIIPIIRKKYKLKPIIHKTILTAGLPESVLAEKISTWEQNLPEHIKLAYLPSPGYIRLRLSIFENDNYDESSLNNIIKELKELIPNNFLAEGDLTPQKAVANLMIEKGISLSTAESCTGGRISSLITSVPGSSVFYKGSIIAYSNEIKKKYLNVPEDVLRKYGAVSKDVVEIMALSVLKNFDTDYSIAVSGIAGPDGGTPQKPVGTIWIAIASKYKVYSKMFNFKNDRIINIERTANTALTMLYQFIEGLKLN